MEEFGLVALVAIGLWLSEGLVRIPRGTWLFRRHGKTWRIEGTADLLHKGPWAWLWLPFWLGRPSVFLAHGSPISPVLGGLWLHSSQAPNPGPRGAASGEFIRWADAPELRFADHQISFRGANQGDPLDQTTLALTRQDLKELVSASESDRAAALDAWAARTTDPSMVRRRLSRLNFLTGQLGANLTLYLCWLLVLMPAIGIMVGWSTIWPALVVITLASQILLAKAARKAHQLLLPDHAKERTAWTIACLLSPLSLLRACEQLAVKSTAGVHPIALAFALAPEEAQARAEFLGPIVRDLLHPCQPLAEIVPDILAHCDLEHRERLLTHLQRRAGMSREALSALVHRPKREDPGAAWCPRCMEAYSRNHGVCTDCGVSLQGQTQPGVDQPGTGEHAAPKPPELSARDRRQLARHPEGPSPFHRR